MNQREVRKHIDSGKRVYLVVTEGDEAYLGVYESEREAWAFVNDYHRSGILRLIVVEAKVYNYSTVEGL